MGGGGGYEKFRREHYPLHISQRVAVLRNNNGTLRF